MLTAQYGKLFYAQPYWKELLNLIQESKSLVKNATNLKQSCIGACSYHQLLQSKQATTYGKQTSALPIIRLKTEEMTPFWWKQFHNLTIYGT